MTEGTHWTRAVCPQDPQHYLDSHAPGGAWFGHGHEGRPSPWPESQPGMGAVRVGWVDQQPPPGWPPLPPPPTRKRRHVFRWIFLAVQVLFLVWIIGGIASSGGTPPSCVGMTGQDLTTCQDAGHLGTTFGVALIVFFWLAVDVILAVGHLIFRKRS
jgi:hypothetical protein